MVDPLKRYRPTTQTLHRSMLDRITDFEPDLLEDRPKTIGKQVQELREHLRRDLEILLNTRRPPITPPKNMTELDNSLVSFGVDGFFTTSLMTSFDRDEFARQLESRVRLFEPRLESTRVSVLPARHSSERSLRLRIEASYVAQEGMPPITFETSVDPSTQRIEVEAPRG